MTFRHAMGAWRDQAECAKRYPPEWWFPVGESPTAQADTDRAKAICARCPVIQECGSEALATGVTHGIWAGLTENELKNRRRDLTIRKAETAKETAR